MRPGHEVELLLCLDGARILLDRGLLDGRLVTIHRGYLSTISKQVGLRLFARSGMSIRTRKATVLKSSYFGLFFGLAQTHLHSKI